MTKKTQSGLAVLNWILAKLMREDAQDRRRNEYIEKNNKMVEEMFDLKDVAENRWRKHHYKADYEEVLWYMDSICREISKRKHHYLATYGNLYVWMLNKDLKKELTYCRWLVNEKKRITE